jgi:serine phosphatase RsbU (regulator of sigma subunit)
MRECIEQELRIARLIQQTLLPKTLPELPGYKLSAFYRPGRERVIGIIAIWELPRLSYPHG